MMTWIHDWIFSWYSMEGVLTDMNGMTHLITK